MLPASLILLPIGIGMLIGVVLALTGAGGSVLAVPLLLFLLHASPVDATGLALGVVAASSAFGAIPRLWRREVLWIPALLFGSAGVVLAPVGRAFATQLPPALLLFGFALLSLLIAARMLWQSFAQPELARQVRAGGEEATSGALLCRFSPHGHFDWRWRCLLGLCGGGVLTGLLSGLFGVGGGFLIVPFLTQLNGVSIRSAIATSLVTIAAIAGSGFAAHIATHTLDWQSLLLLGGGGIAGMMLGSLVARRVANAHLQRFFAITIIAMATLVLWRALHQ